MFCVRRGGAANPLAADDPIRVTNRVDRCDGSRAKEPVRARRGHLAALINERTQANDPADSQATRPAQAMTIIAALAITLIRVEILAVGYRTVKEEFLPIGPAASRARIASVGTQSVNERRAH